MPDGRNIEPKGKTRTTIVHSYVVRFDASAKVDSPQFAGVESVRGIGHQRTEEYFQDSAGTLPSAVDTGTGREIAEV